MTPEERARLLTVEVMKDRHGPQRRTLVEFEMLFASAIREAENGALERAALLACDLTDSLGLSDRIRALKHKDIA